MKTEEDEAFEAIARRQGGFQAKRQMAADKLQEPVSFPCCGYTDANAIKWNQFNGVVQCHMCGQVYTVAQPAQEPVAWPKATPKEQIIGWTLDYKFLESLSDTADGRPSMETVESVLLLAVRQVQSVAPPQPAQEPVAFDAFLESEDFYNLMQTYRHFQTDAIKPFEAVKDALRAAHNIKKKNT
jgi:hypothetical protein